MMRGGGGAALVQCGFDDTTDDADAVDDSAGDFSGARVVTETSQRRESVSTIVGAMVRPANEPEHEALAVLTPHLSPHGPLAESLIDRGYLGSADVGTLHAREVATRATAWTSSNRGRFPKSAFVIQLVEACVTCPRSSAPIADARLRFTCRNPCCNRSACNRNSRRVRQRTTIEHSLARIDHIQGPEARYKGIRKHTLDV
jgi:hypothetical protein